MRAKVCETRVLNWSDRWRSYIIMLCLSVSRCGTIMDLWLDIDIHQRKITWKKKEFAPFPPQEVPSFFIVILSKRTKRDTSLSEMELPE